MKSDEAYVKHIRDAISTSQEYVAGMSEDDFLQNKLIHHYFGVDLAEVWKTVKDDLPEIHEALKS